MGKIIRNGINYSSTTDAAKNINYDNSQSGLKATTTQKAIDELNKKIAAGGGGSSSNIVYLTQAEYDALPDDKLEDDIEYWITDAGVRGSAENVSYDASASGLDAKNVQEAVDKLAEGAGNKVEYLTQEEYDALPEDKLTNNIEYRILDSGTPTTARNVGYDGTVSGIDAVNVQGAIDKVSESLKWKKIAQGNGKVDIPIDLENYNEVYIDAAVIYSNVLFHSTLYIMKDLITANEDVYNLTGGYSQATYGILTNINMSLSKVTLRFYNIDTIDVSSTATITVYAR